MLATYYVWRGRRGGVTVYVKIEVDMFRFRLYKGALPAGPWAANRWGNQILGAAEVGA